MKDRIERHDGCIPGFTASRHMRGLWYLIAWSFAAGCGSPAPRWPFPPAESADDAAVIRTLQARVTGVQTLYATLSMSIEMPERSAVADAAISYRSPGSIRMSVFKDLLVSSREVFDVVITPERFALLLETDTGAEWHEGVAEDLGRLYPGFRAIGALREAMFLPGHIERGAVPRVTREGEDIEVETLTSAGFLVTWQLDRRTLGVRRARVQASGSVITIEYPSYREVDGRFFPERFDLRDPENRVAISGVLDELELNPELAQDVFMLSPRR